MWYCDRCNRYTTDLSKEHKKRCEIFKKEKAEKMSKCVCGAKVRDTIIHFGAWLNDEIIPIGVTFTCGTTLEQNKLFGWKIERTNSCYSMEIYNLKQKIEELEK
jgi:hypothetical protein